VNKEPLLFDQLGRQLLASSLSFLREWLPLGRLKGGEYQVGSLAGEGGDSLSINIKSGKWSDFATGERGGDLISLYAGVKSISQVQAFKELSSDCAPTLPPPKSLGAQPAVFKPFIPTKKPDSINHPHRGKPDSIWAIRNPEGKVVCYTCRYNKENGGKDVVTYSYGDFGGKIGWYWKAIPDRRPIYGLHEYKDGDKIVICEGEKSRDAAHQLLGEGYCPVAWIGGCNAITKTDWSTMPQDVEIIIWPDADEPGIRAAEQLQGIFKGSVILDVSDKDDKWDSADALEEGWTSEEARAFVDGCADISASPRQILTLETEEEDFLGNDIAGYGDIVSISGAPKAGKSDLLMQWLINAALGKPFLGFEPSRPLRVYYAQAELKLIKLKGRIKSLGLSDQELDILENNFEITDRLTRKYPTYNKIAPMIVKDMKRKFKGLPPDIIVLDPLVNLSRGLLKEESNNIDMINCLTQMRSDITDAVNPNSVLFVVHHASKGKRADALEDPFNSIRGAGSLRGACDSNMVLMRPEETTQNRKLFFEFRNGPPVDPMTLFKIDGKWTNAPYNSDRIANITKGELNDKERTRKYDIILKLLAEEALDNGMLYTDTMFASHYDGKHGLGSETGIKQLINVLARKQIIKYSQINYMEHPLPARSKGFIVIDQVTDKMLLRQVNQENGVITQGPIQITHYADKNTGAIIGVND
jgi:hypothetical protein